MNKKDYQKIVALTNHIYIVHIDTFKKFFAKRYENRLNSRKWNWDGNGKNHIPFALYKVIINHVIYEWKIDADSQLLESAFFTMGNIGFYDNLFDDRIKNLLKDKEPDKTYTIRHHYHASNKQIDTFYIQSVIVFLYAQDYMLEKQREHLYFSEEELKSIFQMVLSDGFIDSNVIRQNQELWKRYCVLLKNIFGYHSTTGERIAKILIFKDDGIKPYIIGDGLNEN